MSILNWLYGKDLNEEFSAEFYKIKKEENKENSEAILNIIRDIALDKRILGDNKISSWVGDSFLIPKTRSELKIFKKGRSFSYIEEKLRNFTGRDLYLFFLVARIGLEKELKEKFEHEDIYVFYIYYIVALLGWIKNNYPFLKLKESQIAALSLCNIPKNLTSNDFRSPWYTINIPLYDIFTFGKYKICSAVLINLVDNEFQVILNCKERLTSDSYRVRGLIFPISNENIILEIDNTIKEQGDALKSIVPKKDIDNLKLCMNCVINTIIAINSNNNYVVKYSEKNKNKNKNKSKNKRTNISEYKLNINVKLDNVKYLNTMLSSGSKKYTSRWLVKGHWRNQPFGVKRKLVKRIFVEPFWKGPEKGLVLNRDYFVTDRKLNINGNN